MVFSKNNKPVAAALTVFIILLASLSVCHADTRRIEARLKQQLQPLNREYIKTPDGRRYAEEVTTINCRLWKRCLLLGDNVASHQWVCSFTDPGISMDVGGYGRKKIVGVDDDNLNHWLESNGAVSGSTMLVLSDAEILPDSVIVDKANVIAISQYDDARSNRRLSSTTGVLDTLVVRVVAEDNSPPEAAVLSEDIFDDEYCLKSQYDRCSYGQLQIQEYVPGTVADVRTVAPGVISIFVKELAEGQNFEFFEEEANIALESVFNPFNVSEGASARDIFDLVIFCMPPGMGDWLSYAYINDFDSYYNDDDCTYVSTLMHEVGHNIGLHHSGEYTGDEADQEYGDQTGYMGYTYESDDVPAMCFNPAKSWELGWYENKYHEVNVFSEISNEATSYKLNGVVDYDPEAGENIVVKIGDFYVGYNKATSFNADVPEAADQVTIIENLGVPGTAAFSKLAAKLSVGDSYTFVLDNLEVISGNTYDLGSSVSVTVEYVSISDETEAVIEVKYAEETVECEGGFDSEIEVEITPDRYPGEISWGIADKNGQYLYLANYGELASEISLTTVEGLCRGVEYFLVLADSFGDGFCCSAGSGGYKVKFEEEEMISGEGLFDNFEVISFSLPSATIECVDDDSKDFVIDVDGDIKTKNCAWLATKKKAKRKELCDENVEVEGEEKELPSICRGTCGEVGKGSCLELTPGPTSSPTASPVTQIDCENKSKNFDIDIDGTTKTKNCAWLDSKKKKKRKEYCKMKVDVNGKNKKLPVICKETCGLLGKGECGFLKDA
jgi:hypothetical protein